MTQFIPYSRDQSFLLPPDLKDWLPSDDVAAPRSAPPRRQVLERHHGRCRVPMDRVALRLCRNTDKLLTTARIIRPAIREDMAQTATSIMATADPAAVPG